MKQLLIFLFILPFNIYAESAIKVAIFDRDKVHMATYKYIHLLDTDEKTRKAILLIEKQLDQLRQDLWLVKNTDELKEVTNEIYFLKIKLSIINSNIDAFSNSSRKPEVVKKFIREKYKNIFHAFIDKRRQEQNSYNVLTVKPVDMTQKIIDDIHQTAYEIK